jgi:putative addiction module component (TIGR02574 family)
MTYKIADILQLPIDEQKAIATAILNHLNETEIDTLTSTEEATLDKRFADIEAGNYESFTIEEVKRKLSSKWQSK